MFLFSKKRNNEAKKENTFSKAFEKRIGCSPICYIQEKIENGSDISAIRQLFQVLSCEIEVEERCVCPGFDFYYEKVMAQILLQPQNKKNRKNKITKAFAESQLIGKERFVQQYGTSLKRLADDGAFNAFVSQLRKELDGQEKENTKAANKQIADYFYQNKANERFPEVEKIVRGVVTYGKQASAHISIYYAMFLYEKEVMDGE